MNRKNIRIYIMSVLIIILIVLCTNCFAYEWGVKSTFDEVELVAPYPINATLGEFRKKTSLRVPRFHFGVDIYGRAGNLVYAIEEGTVLSKSLDSNNSGYAASITIGRFTYTHLHHFINVTEDGYESIALGKHIEKGQAIAFLGDIDYPHLHLQEKDTVGGQVVNPLRRVGGLSGYSDNGWPMVFGFKFYRDWNDVNSTKEQIDNFVDKVIVLDGNVDILAKTKDRQNQAMTVDTAEGKKVTLWPSQNTGIYQIGYQVQNQFQVDKGLKDNKKDYVVRKTDQIKFDGLPQGDTPAYWVYDYQENLIGQSSDKTSIDKYYCYWATNKMYSNDYWDTTQHPDGKYTVSVLAWDIAGNGGDVAGSKGAASQKVIINNKRPVIKSISVADNSDADKMFKAGDKIELAIEFDEQLNPDKLPVLYIGAPKADGEKVEWIKVNAESVFLQSSIDPITSETDSSKRIKDSVWLGFVEIPDLGDSKHDTTAELKIKVTNVYGLGGDQDLMVEDDIANVKTINADAYRPFTRESNVFPRSVKENESQKVTVYATVRENESGINSELTVKGRVTGKGHDQTYDTETKDLGNGIFSVRFDFTSPVVAGTYQVSIEIPGDIAGNKPAKSTQIGSLVVKEEPKESTPTPPDESLDVFDSVFTDSETPYFGIPKIAILKSGYALEMKDLLASFGEAADYIVPENFGPGLIEKYPLLIIPSAGLSAQNSMGNFKEKLSGYVANGGKVVVMTQPMDECYSLLPGRVEGIGYFQDKACYNTTGNIQSYNHAVAGQNDTTVDGTADGVITVWPEGTQVWLNRIKNNFPALIAYPYGEGKVVVSSYYSDYAHGHSQLHKDEKALLRDLLSWGRDFADNLPEVKPGQAMTIDVPVEYLLNEQKNKVSRVNLIIRSPGRKVVTEESFGIDLGDGGKTVVPYYFNNPDSNNLGIWWINYELYDESGVLMQSEVEGQRVVVSKHLENANTANIAVTVSPSVTNALEGAKIPFKVILQNSSAASRTINYRVFAVLGSFSGRVTKEEEVDSGSVMVNSNSSESLILEEATFKAYASTDLESWAKNWWRFVFYDENGEEIITEMRGISVYKPCAQFSCELENLSNPESRIYNPGDEIAVDLKLINNIAIGYPIDWEVTIRANDQAGQIIYQSSGQGELDPLLEQIDKFTIPNGSQITRYLAEVIVKYKNSVIPVIQLNTNNITDLYCSNFRIGKEGIYFDIKNRNNEYVDYQIISRLLSDSVTLEDSFFGGIDALASETKVVTFDINKLIEGASLQCFVFDPVSGRVVSSQIYRFNSNIYSLEMDLLSLEYEKTTGEINCMLSIFNKSLPISNAELLITSAGSGYDTKIALPDIGMIETIEFPVKLQLQGNANTKEYPILFKLISEDENKKKAFELGSRLSVFDFEIAEDNVTLNLKNLGMLPVDYSLTTKFYNGGVLLSEDTSAGWLDSDEAVVDSSVVNYNPFKVLNVNYNLTSLLSGEDLDYRFIRKAYNLNLVLDTMNQTAVGNKIVYSGTIKNAGIEAKDLKLRIDIKDIGLSKEISMPLVKEGEAIDFSQTFDLPETTPAGVYPVKFTFVSKNGFEQAVTQDVLLVAAPELSVEGLIGNNQPKPGDIYGISVINTGENVTDINYEVRLTDINGLQLAAETGTAQLVVGEKIEPNWILPSNLASGIYKIDWNIQTAPRVRNISGTKLISVAGGEVGLNVATEKSVYQIDQTVSALTEISNLSATDLDGKLNLEIFKLTPVTDGLGTWSRYGGNLSGTSQATQAGGIDEPFVTWNMPRDGYVYEMYPLIGNVMGDESNETIYFTNVSMAIIDGRTGQALQMYFFPYVFPNIREKVTAVTLADVDQDGYQEILICVDGKYIAALRGTLELLWVRNFDQVVLDNPLLVVCDLENDGSLEVLLDGYVINAATGETLKTDTEIGVVAELNSDGNINIISKDKIYDHDFQVISSRADGIVPKRYPVVADLDGNGTKEIILFDDAGIYVYDHQYQQIWGQAITKVASIAVGDVNGDGKQEVVGIQCDFDPTLAMYLNIYTYKLVSYDADGTQLFAKSLTMAQKNHLQNYNSFKSWSPEVASLAIADINGDGQSEIISGNLWDGVRMFDGEGNLVVDMSDRLNIVSPFAIGDVDNDGQAEIVAIDAYSDGLLCIDGSKGLNEPQIYQPYDELPVAPALYSYVITIVQDNGDIWAAGENYVSYYRAATHETGVVAIKIAHISGENLIIVLNQAVIEVWNSSTKTMLGTIDPATAKYTENIKQDNNLTLINPLLSHGGYYYSYNLNDGLLEIYRTNLETAIQENLGTVEGNFTDAEIEIFAVMDENTLIAQKAGGSALRIPLADQKAETLSVVLPKDESLQRLNSNNLLYFKGDSKGLYMFDLANDQEKLVVDWSRLEDYIKQSTVINEVKMSFAVKDDDNVYLTLSNNPALLQYCVSKDEISQVASMVTHGLFGNRVCRIGQNLYYMYENSSLLFQYNIDTKETKSFAVPHHQRKFAFGRLIKTASGKVLIVGNYMDQLSLSFLTFDPVTQTWEENNPQTLPTGMSISDSCVGQTDDVMYLTYRLNNTYYLGVYQKSTGAILNYDSVSASSGYIDNIVYDRSTKKLFYLRNGAIYVYDEQNQSIKDLYIGMPYQEFSLVGAKNNELYLIYRARSTAGRFGSYGLFKYSLTDQQLSKLSMFSSRNLQNLFGGVESQIYNLASNCLDDDLNSLYYSNKNTIIELDLTAMDFDDIDSMLQPGTSTKYVKVFEENVAVVAGVTENTTLTTIMGGLDDPGTYALEGMLSNELAQKVARDRMIFYVSDGILDLSLNTENEYYKPGQTVLIGQTLNNVSGTKLKGLKLVLSCLTKDQRVILKELDFDLAVGETLGLETQTAVELAGDIILEALIYRDNQVVSSCYKKISIANPKVKVEIDVPEAVSSKRFDIFTKLVNESPFSVELNLSSLLLQKSERVVLEPFGTIVLQDKMQISTNAEVDIALSGDVTAVYSKPIEFAESIKFVTADYISGNGIPYQIINDGKVAVEIPVSFNLYREEQVIAEETFGLVLNAGETFEGVWLLPLSAGDYCLGIDYSDKQQKNNFTFVPEYAADLIVGSVENVQDILTMTVDVANLGFNSLQGELKVEATFDEQEIEIEVPSGESRTYEVPLSNLPAEDGLYEIKVSLINMGKTLVSRKIDYNHQGTIQSDLVATADLQFVTDLSEGFFLYAGQENVVNLQVKNVGNKSGDGIIEFVCDNLFAETADFTLAADAEYTASFEVSIPDDYESGIYEGKVVLNGQAVDFNYQIIGCKLKVTASLDKKSYLKGETAVLTLQVASEGQNSIPMQVRVKQGDFDETKPLDLNASDALSFNIPLNDFNEKIFYGFYSTETGRSLYLDVCNVYQSLPGLEVEIDKQRCNAGDVIQVSVKVAEEGLLGISGPGGFTELDNIVGNKVYSIQIPSNLQTGTYSIWLAFAGETLEYKVDVLGHNVRFVSNAVNLQESNDGTVIAAEVVVVSDGVGQYQIVWDLVKPDKSVVALQNQEVELVQGENTLRLINSIDSGFSGTHWLQVSVISDGKTISKGRYPFIQGKVELLNIETSCDKYVDVTQPVTGNLYLYGAGKGNVALKLDGMAVTNVSVNVEGAIIVPYSLGSVSITPGEHLLEAVFSGDQGNSQTVSTNFIYGSGLPDFYISKLELGKEITDDNKLPIGIVVKKEGLLATENVWVQVKLAGEILSEFCIEQFAGGADSYEKTLYWDHNGLSGNVEVQAEVNYNKDVAEYDLKSNIATATIIIPQIPQFVDLPGQTNDAFPVLSGIATPNTIVYLYNDQGLLSFTSANEAGVFEFANVALIQGINELRLQGKTKEGWKSAFSDVSTLILDSIMPEIVFENIVDNSFINEAIVPEVAIYEDNLVEVVYDLDGAFWEVGTAVSAAGRHCLTVKVTDIAGNCSDGKVIFTIDMLAPEIFIDGVVDGVVYSEAVMPKITVTDDNLELVTRRLNDVGYEGETISEAGQYNLEVFAIDKAGNGSSRRIEFTIEAEEQTQFDYAILCDEIKLYGNLISDRVFVNGNVYFNGQCQVAYLGTGADSIVQTGTSKVEVLEVNQTTKAILQPKWTDIKKVTTERNEPGIYQNCSLNNVYFTNSLMISAAAELSGLIVVDGDLMLYGNVELEDAVIICRGKITVSGGINGNGLVYANSGVINYGNSKINGAMIIEGLLEGSGTVEVNSADVSEYLVWFE